MMFVSNLNYVAVCVLGGLRVASGTMSLGDVQAFIQYVQQFGQPIAQDGERGQRAAVGGGFGRAGLRDARRGRRSRPTPARPAVLKEVEGHIVFEDVSFRYLPDTPLIEDLNLEVKPGQTVAIVGPTGAGKTTLVNLLMRFYEIDEGSITIDGVDTRAMTRDDLRRLFGMVLQDAWLFSGTIRENIAYGREGATEEEIQAAAEAAHVHHFVRALARGLRHQGGGRLHQHLPGGEAAAHHRPGVPGRPADPHPGRGHQLGGHADRGAHPAGHGQAAQGPHQLRHRAPAVDHPRCRRHPGDEPGRHRRAGYSPRAAVQGRLLLRPLQQPVRGGAGRGLLGALSDLQGRRRSRSTNALAKKLGRPPDARSVALLVEDDAARWLVLCEVAVQQTLEGLAVAGLVPRHLVHGVVDGVVAEFLGQLGQLHLARGGAVLGLDPGLPG